MREAPAAPARAARRGWRIIVFSLNIAFYEALMRQAG
jgi:hypothetical protein